MAGYTQGTFFNVTQTDDVDFNQWDEVEELNEKATPSEMLGFNLDTSNIETELANCRAVYENTILSYSPAHRIQRACKNNRCRA